LRVQEVWRKKGMAAGRAAAMVVAVASAAVLLLAGGAYADCYNDCFDDCTSRMKQRDYCSYACDKVCSPDADATLHQRPRPRPLAVVGPAVLPDHRLLDKKQDADAVRPAALPDHPFHETHGGGVKPTGEPDPGHVVRPARVPVLP
jgi:hypothetical protein